MTCPPPSVLFSKMLDHKLGVRSLVQSVPDPTPIPPFPVRPVGSDAAHAHGPVRQSGHSLKNTGTADGERPQRPHGAPVRGLPGRQRVRNGPRGLNSSAVGAEKFYRSCAPTTGARYRTRFALGSGLGGGESDRPRRSAVRAEGLSKAAPKKLILNYAQLAPSSAAGHDG